MRLKYALIRRLAADYPIRRLCQTLKVHPSGYYAWLASPHSARAKEDQRLLGLIKHAWLESGGIYSYRKIHDDLRELGERCGRHRVARLMRQEGIRSQTGYRRHLGRYGGTPAQAAPSLDALLMAVWRRKPKQAVMVHSDEGGLI